MSSDENNKIIYDMNLNSFMDVMEEASMVSLFSPIKVIIVNNFILDNLNDNEFEYLERFVNNKEHKDYVTEEQYTFKNIITYKVKNYTLDDVENKLNAKVRNGE